MKIKEQVRDFAAKQNSESYLAASAPVADAEAGMDEMSRVYNESGREMYVGKGNQVRDWPNGTCYCVSPSVGAA